MTPFFHKSFTPSTPDEPDIQNMTGIPKTKCRVIPFNQRQVKPGKQTISPMYYDDNEEVEKIEKQSTFIPEELLLKSNSAEELVPIVAPEVSGYDKIRKEVELERQLEVPVEVVQKDNKNNKVTNHVMNLLQKFGETKAGSPKENKDSDDLIVTGDIPGKTTIRVFYFYNNN